MQKGIIKQVSVSNPFLEKTVRRARLYKLVQPWWDDIKAWGIVRPCQAHQENERLLLITYICKAPRRYMTAYPEFAISSRSLQGNIHAIC